MHPASVATSCSRLFFDSLLLPLAASSAASLMSRPCCLLRLAGDCLAASTGARFALVDLLPCVVLPVFSGEPRLELDVCEAATAFGATWYSESGPDADGPPPPRTSDMPSKHKPRNSIR
jgi:hypothetical protein